MTTAWVVNLPGSESRWANAQHECARADLTAVRFAALGPAGGRQRLPGSPLTGGALGLAASVDAVLERIADGADHDDGSGDWVFIIEDDVRMRRRAVPITNLLGVLETAPASVGLVWAGYCDTNPWWRRGHLDPKWTARLVRLRLQRARHPRSVPFMPLVGFGGSQGLALRVGHAGAVRRAMAAWDRPVDRMVASLVADRPDLFAQTRVSWMTQQPFDSELRRVAG